MSPGKHHRWSRTSYNQATDEPESALVKQCEKENITERHEDSGFYEASSIDLLVDSRSSSPRLVRRKTTTRSAGQEAGAHAVMYVREGLWSRREGGSVSGEGRMPFWFRGEHGLQRAGFSF